MTVWENDEVKKLRELCEGKHTWKDVTKKLFDSGFSSRSISSVVCKGKELGIKKRKSWNNYEREDLLLSGKCDDCKRIDRLIRFRKKYVCAECLNADEKGTELTIDNMSILYSPAGSLEDAAPGNIEFTRDDMKNIRKNARVWDFKECIEK